VGSLVAVLILPDCVRILENKYEFSTPLFRYQILPNAAGIFSLLQT
jgi:hypothetical protein